VRLETAEMARGAGRYFLWMDEPAGPHRQQGHDRVSGVRGATPSGTGGGDLSFTGKKRTPIDLIVLST
jgi:hypothetical protein